MGNGRYPRKQIMNFETFLLLTAGLVLLVVGAEGLVRGASRLAAAMGISPLVIGLTVVAFGTSSPELAVSLQSALQGTGRHCRGQCDRQQRIQYPRHSGAVGGDHPPDSRSATYPPGRAADDWRLVSGVVDVRQWLHRTRGKAGCCLQG
jgi:hypothetical protein